MAQLSDLRSIIEKLAFGGTHNSTTAAREDLGNAALAILDELDPQPKHSGPETPDEIAPGEVVRVDKTGTVAVSEGKPHAAKATPAKPAHKK